MAEATIVETTLFKNGSMNRIYSMGSVAASTHTHDTELDVGRVTGNLSSIKVSSATSTDFDFIVANKAAQTDKSIYEIYRREDNNLAYGETGICVNFNTANKMLYFSVDNNDSGNATGLIFIQLFIGT